jgi:hypothetical protein
MRTERSLNNSSFLIGKFAIILILFPFAANGQTSSQSSMDRLTIRGYVDISTNYNDNILEYSSGDIEKFGLAKYSSSAWKKFSINKLNDNITIAKFRAASTLNLFNRAPTSISLRTYQYLYHSSQIRNYGSWQAQLRQYFLRNNYISFTYNAIPRYYLRNYWYHQIPERNPYRLFDRYVEAYIKKQSYSIDVGRKFSTKFSAEAGYEHEYIEYNHEFSERNNHRYNVTFSARLKTGKIFEWSGNYSHTQSWADGRNNPDTTLVDISYKAYRIGIGLDLQLRPILKIPLKWSHDFTYESQAYLSDRTDDVYHYGRKDESYRFTTALAYRIFKNLDVYIQYYWEENKTNLPETNDAGDYQKHQIGGGIKVTF